ncbi:MAG: outer membrane beta-barrel protein [bacterium]|nr:outer membrane beta-barrel protein [bacterium]
MQHLQRHKVIAIVVFLFTTCTIYSQGREHNALYDLQKIHFGFSIVPNFGKAKVVTAADFYQRDSVRAIRPQGFSGFGFGGLMDVRLGKYVTFRYLPQIQFSQRNFIYTFDDRVETAKTETVALDQCLSFKYHTPRHQNSRFYLIGGLKFSYDFASNEDAVRSPNRALVPFKKNTLYYDFGFGYEHFGLFAVFGTEFKMSNSITNVLSKDPYIYTSSIDRIQSRLFQISFHFQ